jgi:two-component system phosphate regulon sensor histidine kinase PhoR
LLLLALPLAIAVWAFGGYAARRERNNADQRLASDLSAAADSYKKVINKARVRATKLARSRPVQRAFLSGGPRAARRIQRRYRNVLLLPGRKGGAIPADAALQVAAVENVRRRTVGRVIVVVPFDADLARRLADNAGLDEGLQIAFRRGRRLILTSGSIAFQSRSRLRRPASVRVNDSRYRAVGVPIEGRNPADLVVLERSSKIAAAADSVRWRVIGVGLGLVGALITMAYALSPAIARSRVVRQQRDQAERVLAHVGDGVLLVGHDGVIRLWNPAAEAITGLRAAAVSDRPAQEAIPGWPAIAALVPVASRPGDGDSKLRAETVPFETADGEIWLSVVGVTLDDGTVYAFRDVTHERRLENLRSQFVATISHELRTPLAALHGAAVTLREHGGDLSSETQDELLAMISAQSKRLADLVEEILVAGQLDAGSLSVVKESFDPELLVRETVAAVQMRLGTEARIDVSIPPVLPKAIGDPDRTRQVLLNLLDNAVKYSPSGNRIDVALAVGDGHIRFAVRDEGLGIPLGEHERIFDKFYRLDPDQRRGIGGSGLGLYISRELLRSMDGRIWAESEPGEGTVFTFELPVAKTAPTPVSV